MNERWRRVKELFEAATEKPTHSSDAFLDLADVDADVRREVKSLLESDARDGSVFDRLPLGGAAVFDVTSRAAFASGFQIGPCIVDALIGSGSMGQVYRARDTRLNRDVALKILPVDLAVDADRLARFRREAHVLATLNHSNIAAIYGLEEAGGVTALVLELVDGPTLAARMKTGRLSLDDLLNIARQLADALAAAHDKGVVHRDLKPANIAIGRDGTVKVLDFGLAKIAESAETSPLQSPHVTATDIHGHTVLGTPTYMSPEQARGQRLDRRTDLWSFGCIVYEMLAQRPPFAGDSVAETMAAVLEHEVDYSALPPDTPPSIRRLLRRCLEKDASKRLDSAASARLEIDDAIEFVPDEIRARRPPPSRSIGRYAIAALAVVVVSVPSAFVLWSRVVRTPADRASTARFAIVTPADAPLNLFGPTRDIAFSPDGRTLAYRAGGTETAGSDLMLRSIDRVDATLARSTLVYSPFFSPDGRWVGFFSRSELQKVAVSGGPAITICEFSGSPLGASWSDNNTIVFAVSGPAAGLWRVSADGGNATRVAAVDPGDGGGRYAFPSVLPGDRGVLFTIEKAGEPGVSQVAVLDLRTRQHKTLIDSAADAQYVETGFLVFTASGSMRAVRFDLDRLEVLGEPVTLPEDVFIKSSGAADFTLTRGGTLAYVTAASGQRPPRSLVWVDRKGREDPLDMAPQQFGPLRISPDGRHVAISRRDGGDPDIWVFDLPGGALRRLTFLPGMNGMPVWTPDGRQIIFSKYDEKGVLNFYRRQSDGTGGYEAILPSGRPRWPTSITPDGTRLFGFELRSQKSAATGNVIVVPLNGSRAEEPKALFEGDFADAQSSPGGGLYLAYQSAESGRLEVYVRAFPDVHKGPWQVSTAGGTRPAWSRDGRELFFLDAANAMNVARVDTSGPTFVSSPPVKLFDTGYYEPNPARHYDVSPDGQRFLMLKQNSDTRSSASMVVVQNWGEELKARLPTR